MMNSNSQKTMVALVFGACIIVSMTAHAQIAYQTIFDFDGTDGEGPSYMALIRATDGNFYGTTQMSDVGCGVVFGVTPSGFQKVLHTFCTQNDDGENPYAGLVQANDGNFYGSTFGGGTGTGCGSKGCGTLFRVTLSGTLTTLYNFCVQGAPCTDGNQPVSALVQGVDGNLYGTTQGGGGPFNGGTIFRLTLGGTLTTLYRFCAQQGCPDGQEPFSLFQWVDGGFYGVTVVGGRNGQGTVFKLIGNTLTTLYSFCSQPGCSDGGFPYGLTIGADGNFYGVTQGGGTDEQKGTIFKVNSKGTLTTLHIFCSNPGRNGGCPDGANPVTPPTLASDGYYFGMTPGSGDNSSIYGVTPAGVFKKLYQYKFPSAGGSAGLVQGTNGLFYGTTGPDSAGGQGTVFSLDVGLDPYVKTQPGGGAIGAQVIILGTNLTGATAVSFNGTPASFTVVSASEITTTVPSGAKTGRVQVATQAGTLTSNLPFVVAR